MSQRKLNTAAARELLQEFRFADLFIEQLGWNNPPSSRTASLDYDDEKWHSREVAQLSGFRVFEVTPASPSTPLPGAAAQLALWKQVVLQSIENIIIFTDPGRTRSVWLWMKRDGKRTLPRRHHFHKGQPGDLFLSKLAALTVDIAELDEDGNLPITETANRVRAALDVEAVTKRFFKDFQEEHAAILGQIKGIPDERDRRWYASVLLNRLMFVWFLQEKLFLDGGRRTYLEDKLEECRKAEGEDKFFRVFLRDLFFQGFARPAARRDCRSKVKLGSIPYLNGGLFLPHSRLEHAFMDEDQRPSKLLYPNLDVPDAAFDGLFALFRRYSWNLDDTPGGADNEINPDVLGYIFEKYINQKDFGAYYTRPEMTGYLCEQTIHALVLDRIRESGSIVPESASLQDVLFNADGPLCERLLHDILPSLTLLDPACGSGAFLVAAMRTMLNLTTAVTGRADALEWQPLLNEMTDERARHTHGKAETPVAYWLKKRIITQNLYGVDLMEEAVEIARLRLFLSLVASVSTVEQLEPLPNIEFNLLAGNSLLGLLRIDAAQFDGDGRSASPATSQDRMEFEHSTGEGELGFSFTTKPAPKKHEKAAAYAADLKQSKFRRILEDKNKSIDLYRSHAQTSNEVDGLTQDERLINLRSHIENLRRDSYSRLNTLLLADFDALGIRYEKATWDEKKKTEGKPLKRKLTVADLDASKPFHWAYEFDRILAPPADGGRGGFDAIITNPPWEIFKPQAKEFFEDHSELVTKNKMRIEEFEKEKAKLLREPDVRDAWLEYQSGYPHLSAWFRGSPQYANQIGTVDGRKVGSDINLYKLFTEQCYNLLRPGGHCGIVIPSGIYTDLGAKQLRVMLFEHTAITGLFGFENRKEIFENVHRSFKFVVLTFERGGQTTDFPAAFMRLDPAELAGFPAPDSLRLTPQLIARLSPGSLSIMEFRSAPDIAISEKMMVYPALRGDEKGWEFEIYGEEVHMNRGSHLFISTPTPLPLYEGGMIWHFDGLFSKPRHWIREAEILEDFLEKRRKRCGLDTVPKDMANDYRAYRIGIRKIASNTNERTLVTTVLPRGAIAGNSLAVHFPFIHTAVDYNKTRYSDSELCLLCALFNSLCVDYFLRSKVTTNLNTFYLEQLPIPRLTENDPAFHPLVERAARLVGTSEEYDALLQEVFGKKATHLTHGVTDPMERQLLRAEIDALVARLYELTDAEFAHILSTFPLVDEGVKLQTRNTYRDLERGSWKP